ncbi:glycine cleavage system protein GcvH [bacterium]|nr:glycine cleavage system protein GcvH [bacterium]
MANIGGYEFPDKLYYHEEHSWVKIEDDGNVRVGMNAFFQGSSGSIIYVDLPFVDDEVEKGDICGKIQSRKWIGNLCAPVSGNIIEINEELENDATLINQDPYGEGWILLIEPTNLDEELAQLMQGEKVQEWIKSEIKKAEQIKTEGEEG